MRSYPRNSPQAAARIVVLAALADGHLAQAELDALDRVGVHQQLGLGADDWHEVVHAFCEDLLATSEQGWGAACKIDPESLAALLAEVDDATLQLTVMRLCLDVIEADAHVADGESIVIQAAIEQWGLASSEPQTHDVWPWPDRRSRASVEAAAVESMPAR